MTTNRYIFKGNDWTGILLWIRTQSKPRNVGPILQLGNLEAQRVAR